MPPNAPSAGERSLPKSSRNIHLPRPKVVASLGAHLPLLPIGMVGSQQVAPVLSMPPKPHAGAVS